MLNLEKLRKIEAQIISIGNHPGINQAILDFDYLAGKESPSLKAIISASQNFERYFFGNRQILVPVFPDFTSLPKGITDSINMAVNVSSGRRTLQATQLALESLPNLLVVNVFAEEVPEKHAAELVGLAQQKGVEILGPASIGLLIPGITKLGAIAGVQAKQLVDAEVFIPGKVAIFSASGGMTNEIISICQKKGKHLSFSLSFGGDRFPATDPMSAFLAAENDPETEIIIYYGELGGYDEYELVELIKSGKVSKKIIAYIAGTISDMFENPPQFGHAKAMAGRGDEKASSKRKALKEVGVEVAENFAEFEKMVANLKTSEQNTKISNELIKSKLKEMENRKPVLFSSSISGEVNDQVEILGEDLMKFTAEKSFAEIAASMFLGRKLKSELTTEFFDIVLKMLVDHGPYQSGAINTMVTARAGKDLASAVAAGLLTIGPRFGGAISEAAANWFQAVEDKEDANAFVEKFAAQRKYILGIGHKKYTIEEPDPRVVRLAEIAEKLGNTPHFDFAREVEKITTSKKANLILNVDGAVAGLLLDILMTAEELPATEVKQLIENDFFNSLFVLSRTVGLIAHYLDQRKLDEGLFRLTPDQVARV
jgi:ATP citrate (pro-S)-lyase